MITEISTKPSDIIRAMRLSQKRKHSPTETPRLKKATTTARTLHEGGVRGVRKPQNRTEIRQKTENRIGFFPEYRNRAYM